MSHGPYHYNADNPGPGAYYLNYNQVLLEAPKPSFGLRTELWVDKARPGPGAYNVRIDGNASPKYTMGKHYNGPPETKTQGPGPGAHHVNLKQTHLHSPAFTAQGKSNYNPDRGIPGPGTYRPQQADHSVGLSLGKKFNPRLSTTPGPGHYSPHSPGSTPPAYSIGQHLVDAKFATPGVGRYNLRSATLQGPMFSMGKRFYQLHEHPQQRRYSKALKSRPNYRQGPHGLPATNSRGGKQASKHVFTLVPTQALIPNPALRRCACEVLMVLNPSFWKKFVRNVEHSIPLSVVWLTLCEYRSRLF